MLFLSRFFINKIEKYKRVSLEESLNSVMKSKNRMIAGKYSPDVFGMNYTELEYTSDDMKMSGWYIPVEGATKTLVFAHGRNNNRVFCIKFLQLFLDMQINEKYNIFLPDFRNSGKSEDARTAFGYYFSRDIKNSIVMLKKETGIKEYIIYGFSQGGMGAALVPYLYKEELEKQDIDIQKLILDSPVSNVEELILENSKIFGIRIPYFFMIYILKIFDSRIDKTLNTLKLSKILGIKPTLILQSEKDEATPYFMVNNECEIIKSKSNEDEKIIRPIFKVFRKGQHVRIYLQYKWEYTHYIEEFLNLV